MTELYNCFVEKRYPEEWDSDWRDNAHYSLGLFLVQYLCNGFNLADAARLVYDDHYFKSGKKFFRFIRKKTVDRSDTEIVIPIIEPLQKIMDEIAAKPEKGALVFPQIYAGETDEKKQRARISQENQNIRKRLGRLVKSMGWEVTPSGTWCRHSFATNLSHAGGVPKEYIQEAMGHSVMSGTVTDRYIQSYPIAQQMVFNSRLLNLNDDADIMEELKGLTPEQIKALIAMVKNV
jgi:integrase